MSKKRKSIAAEVEKLARFLRLSLSPSSKRTFTLAHAINDLAAMLRKARHKLLASKKTKA